MSSPWVPELVVDAGEARAWIERQFPELAPATVEPLGAGWDATVFRVRGELVFRFPRRAIAVPLFEREAQLLPWIAPLVPVPIPCPRWRGRCERGDGWPFLGYGYLSGRSACQLDLDDAARERLATPLGEFLRTLHALDAGEARRRGAQSDPLQRLVVEAREPRLRARLEELALANVIASARAFDGVLDECRGLAPPAREVVLHGDLYVRHLLIDERGSLSGVIDWGDVHVGSPATDLALAWSFLGGRGRATFRDAYGPIDSAQIALARLRALDHATSTALFGLREGDRALLRESRRALASVLEPFDGA